MDGAKHPLDVAIYSLTKTEIVKAIPDAYKRGVGVMKSLHPELPRECRLLRFSDGA